MSATDNFCPSPQIPHFLLELPQGVPKSLGYLPIQQDIMQLKGRINGAWQNVKPLSLIIAYIAIVLTYKEALLLECEMGLGPHK